MLHFDEYDMEMTAEILVKINKAVTDPHYLSMDKDELISFMKSMANQYLYDKNTIFSTGGFLLSVYTNTSGKRVVRASVTPFVIQSYLNAVENRMKNLLDAA